MNEKTNILQLIAMLSVFTTPWVAHASIKQQFKDVFGIVSTSDYLTRLYNLRQMEDTLTRINQLNQYIVQQEKNIAGTTSKTKADLDKSITDGENALQALRNEILRQSALKTKDLNDRINARQGNIEDLTAAQKQEGALTRWANTADYWSLGYASRATNVMRLWDQASIDNLQTQITARRKSISQLQAEISKEQQATQKYFTSPEYQAKVQEINNKLQAAKMALTQIESSAAKMRQETVFSRNPEAERLLAQLKQQIANAKCSTITDIASAKQNAINACKQQSLNQATKAMNVPACKTITINSSPSDIDACIKAYRATK